MGVRFLEHFTILTPDPDATRDWFCRNLGLEEGDHPDFGFPVYWLYIGRQDVLHIGKARHSQHQDTYMKAPGDQPGVDYTGGGGMGSGRVDHVCFNCEGLEDFIERLTRNNVEFGERRAHGSDIYQLFTREPVNGVKVELNFPWHEAVQLGRVPDWTSTGANDVSAKELAAHNTNRQHIKDQS